MNLTGNTLRNQANTPASSFSNDLLMDRSLKGLLMDKGAAGLDMKLQQFLQRITLVQAAMEALVEQQRLSREESGCDCLDLYLAMNLKTGRDKLEAERIKELSMLEIQVNHSKSAPHLEWRARRGFASTYDYPTAIRVHAFNNQHAHYDQVREYVSKNHLDYYNVLAGYDAIRVSLNYAFKNLRKTIFDLTSLSAETSYPLDVEREAENMSRRIFKGLPDSDEIAKVLSQLYC